MRRSEKDREVYRETRGCHGRVNLPVAQWQYAGTKEVFNFYTCPTNIKENYFSHLIGLYYDWKDGRTIYSQDKMNLPAKFVQYMEIISSLVYTKMEHERKKQERAAKRGKRN